MDYSKLSDFEINKAVAEVIGLLVQEMDDSSTLGMTPEFHEKHPAVVWVANLDCSTGRQNEAWWQFDPCNDPADAWPVIVENNLWVQPDMMGDGFWHVCDTEQRFHAKHSNPLRAAMIVYLMMQESNLTPLQSPKQGS